MTPTHQPETGGETETETESGSVTMMPSHASSTGQSNCFVSVRLRDPLTSRSRII